jgi:hypothetical protein
LFDAVPNDLPQMKNDCLNALKEIDKCYY